MKSQYIILGLVGILVLGGIIAFNPSETQKGEMQMEKVMDKDKMMGTDKMMEKTITVALVAQNNSGEMGTAVLSEMGTQTRVMVKLTGSPTGVSQPMHIHGGACPKPGAVLYPLTNAIDGISETVLDVSLSKILGELPLAINVHKSATEAKVFVSCGNITASTMEGGEKMMGVEAVMGAGVVYMDGKISLEEGKTMTPLTKEYMFETGVKVSLTGLVTKKDGSTVQLKSGESAWGDGSIMSAGDGMMKKETLEMPNTEVKKEMMSDAMTQKPGQYIPYASEKLALAATGKVVLFFRASWCPTCRAVDTDIRAHLKDIPEHVTILDVNYDDSASLKQKYGVTYQHTFVEVDAQGNMIKKWSGSPTLAALVGEIK